MTACVCTVCLLPAVIAECELRVPWSGAKDRQIATRASNGRVSSVWDQATGGSEYMYVL